MSAEILSSIITLAALLPAHVKLALLITILPGHVSLVAMDGKQICFSGKGTSDFTCITEAAPTQENILTAQQVVEGWTGSTPVE